MLGDKKVSYSAMQSTGTLTLGNYLGALDNWLKMQEEYECFYAIADLHSLTIRQNPAELRKRARDLYALYVAAGLDPEKNCIYFQSHVSAHAELAWILNCFTYMGELNRMTQFKDKAAKHADNINAGLFTYPSLMAADILLYQADVVPVGVDQKQHLELTRDIANRFNGIYGDVFTIPEPYIGKSTAKIMSLQDPSRKMSKSDENPNASIYLMDDPDTIMRKCKRAVTDSEAQILYREEQPGVKNLIDIYSACTGKTPDETVKEFDGKGYGDFKMAVGEAVVSVLKPLQDEYARLEKDKAFIEKLKEKYNVQTEFIPSIRVTSGNCAEHTGISATEYKRLTGKQVHLKNDEIYVVYQWDRSEYGTIGLDFGKLKPRLYTGCATADIWIYTARTLPGNKFTRKYTIKGNDRRIITGNFKTRVLSTSNMNTDVFEDIIVFSDHEYDKISQKAKGSNLTVVMNVPQNYDVVVNKITNYAAKHSQINFFDYHDGNLIYDKKQCTIEDQENRMLNVSAMLIDMLVLFISIIFILLEKISSDYEALEWKYLFYYRTGMPEKKRRKNIYKEITMTSKVALITGMFIAAVMILVKILYKKMPVYWTKIYLAEAAVMIIGVTAFIMIIVRIAAWRSFKHSERRNKDE